MYGGFSFQNTSGHSSLIASSLFTANRAESARKLSGAVSKGQEESSAIGFCLEV